MAQKRQSRTGRLRKFVAFAAATLSATAMVVTTSTGPVQAASPTSNAVFEVDATVSNPDAGVPPNVGVTGSFVIDNIDDRTNNVTPAENSNGEITVQVQTSTKFYKCDSNGLNCSPSTQDQVVTNQASVRVDGRYYVTNGNYQFLATYVFSPPPADTTTPPPPPNPPNPTPSSPKDYLLADIYYYQASVVRTGSDLAGGWTIGNFVDYGCGTDPGCRTELIARAHGNSLIIDPQPNSAYWSSTDGGCTYAKTDKNTVLLLGAAQGLNLTGHYTSDGGDWIFFASNVFAPPLLPNSNCNTTSNTKSESVTATLGKTQNGVQDPVNHTWTGVEFSGVNGAPGNFGAGSSVMTSLTWQQTSSGDWMFWGTYKVAAAQTDNTSVSGEINGVVAAPSPFSLVSAVNAQLTVSGATGKYQDYQGIGTWSGTVTWNATDGNPGPDTSQPPVSQNGTWQFSVAKPQ